MSLINEVELKYVSDYGVEKIEAELLNSSNYISTDNLIPEKGGAVSSDYLPTKGRVSKYSIGDTLVSNIRPYFKKILFAKESGGCSNDVIVFKPKLDKIDSKYLYYQLSKDEFFDFMMAGANGTKMPRGNKNSIPLFKIFLPPLPTQRRIASILSAYDDLIENNLKRIKLLEEIAQRTYEEWFVKFRVNGEQLPIDEKTGLPVGWERKRLSNIMDIEGGTQPPKSQWSDTIQEGYIRMIQIRDYYTDSHIAYVKHSKNLRTCNSENIMIARYGASVGRICWGLEGAYNVALVKVKETKPFYREYLRWYLKSELFQGTLLNMTQRTAQDGFNKETFNSIWIELPSDSVIKKYDTISKPVFNLIEKLKFENQKLKESRDILLPKLMNGTINVEKE